MPPNVFNVDPTGDGINLSSTFASVYWGFVVSVLLGGISILQAYIYFPRTKDRLAIQIIAGGMIVLDIVSTALVAESVYFYLIPHFGSLSPLSSLTIGLSVECLISTILTFVSQLYFVYQIYTVKKGNRYSWPLAAIIGFFAVGAFVGGVGCVAYMVVEKHGVLSNRASDSHFSIFFGIAKGFGALTDIIATIAMCTILSFAKSSIKETNKMLNSIMQIIVERGALVTLIQTLLLITFFAAPDHLYWLAFHINVTKLYVNVFFAMLNARHISSTEVSTYNISSGTGGVASYRFGQTNSQSGGAVRFRTSEDDMERDNFGAINLKGNMRIPGPVVRITVDEETKTM